jgi:prepilin-type processing-associated H-X9-DG protein
MYKILGADQKEYGPVSAEQVREWVAQGRANAQTLVQPEGATDWRPLPEFADFAEVLNPAAWAQSGPPRPMVTAVPAASAKTSGLAISSLVLGLLGLFTCGITSLVGVVLGIVALVKIEKSKGQLGGRGMALAGLILSGLMLLVLPFMAAMALPAFANAKAKAESIQCMNNVRQLNLALVMYADGATGQFPAGGKWCDAIQPQFVRNASAFICPKGKAGQRSHYAFNARLSGVDPKSLSSPATTVLAFEADGGWNLSGGPELLPATPRHKGGYIVGFADGHAEMVKPERMSQLRWNP